MSLTEENIADEVIATKGPNVGKVGVCYDITSDGTTVFVGDRSGDHWEDAAGNWIPRTNDGAT